MLKNIKKYIITVAVLLSLMGCGQSSELIYVSESSVSSNTICEQASMDSEATVIYVHICGEVRVPGVYELPSESRLYEAVAAAGGFTADADEDYLNQALVLEDGQRYVIYSVAETEQMSTAGEEATAVSHYDSEGRLNINTATLDELKQLSGVGDTKAKAILEYREANGDFESVTDIMNVSGIGQGLYTGISGDITVF